MGTPTLASPNVDNLQVGKGIVSFKRTGAADFRDMGNVTEISITPDLTTLEHFTSRLGVKTKDKTVILEKKGTVKIVMEEITAANFALMAMGTIDEAAVGGPTVEIFSESEITGELKFVGTNDIGPKITVSLYRISITPGGDINLISDEWNNMELTCDMLAATDGANAGKFGLAQWTDTAPAS